MAAAPRNPLDEKMAETLLNAYPCAAVKVLISPMTTIKVPGTTAASLLVKLGMLASSEGLVVSFSFHICHS